MCKCPTADRIPEEKIDFYKSQKFDQFSNMNIEQPKNSPIINENQKATLEEIEREMRHLYKQIDLLLQERNQLMPSNEMKIQIVKKKILKHKVPRMLATKLKQKKLKLQKLRENVNYDMDTDTDHDDEWEDDVDDNDSDYIDENISTDRSYQDYSATIKFGQRYYASAGLMAGMINKTLSDLGITDPKYYTSRGKIHYQIKKLGRDTLVEHSKNKGFKAIGFDSRIDSVAMKYNKVSRQSNCSVIDATTGEYIDHFSSSNGSGISYAKELHDILVDTQSTDTLECISSDGPTVNTGVGKKGGVIFHLERSLGRALQISICLLHFIELIFKALFFKLDGPSLGPDSYAGDCGKQISKMSKDPENELKPFVQFATIEGPAEILQLDETDPIFQNKDVRTLFKYCKAVMTGDTTGLDYKSPFGHLNLARWVTSCCGLVRLYMQTNEPSEVLLRLVNFIINFYLPIWIGVKKDPHITKGSIHFLKAILLSREVLSTKPFKRPNYKQSKSKTYSISGDVSYNEQEIANKVFANNPYWCHPENILLAAIFSDDIDTRQWALQKIKEIRLRNSNDDDIRKFVPLGDYINFKAKSIKDMLYWSRIPIELITEPPMLKRFTMQELEAHVIGIKSIVLANVPCHSTNVERAVKNTTEACRKAIGKSAQKALILTVQKSRNELSSLFKKSQMIPEQKLNFFIKRWKIRKSLRQLKSKK